MLSNLSLSLGAGRLHSRAFYKPILAQEHSPTKLPHEQHFKGQEAAAGLLQPVKKKITMGIFRSCFYCGKNTTKATVFTDNCLQSLFFSALHRLSFKHIQSENKATNETQAFFIQEPKTFWS